MTSIVRKLRNISLVILVVITEGCATVPKEIVELSYITGKDLQSIYVSYDTMIHQFYENMRSQRRVYLDDVWYPRFLENWRDDGELIAIAKGEKIWSVTDEKLILTPAGSDPVEKLNTLNDWVTYALYAYELKESNLLKSLNDEEKELRIQVKQSFDRLIKANATITAHLNSLRKVQEVQDEALEALDIKQLRDNINDSLINASKKAEESFKKVKEADSKIDDLVLTIDTLKQKHLEGD